MQIAFNARKHLGQRGFRIGCALRFPERRRDNLQRCRINPVQGQVQDKIHVAHAGYDDFINRHPRADVQPCIINICVGGD